MCSLSHLLHRLLHKILISPVILWSRLFWTIQGYQVVSFSRLLDQKYLCPIYSPNWSTEKSGRFYFFHWWLPWPIYWAIDSRSPLGLQSYTCIWWKVFHEDSFAPLTGFCSFLGRHSSQFGKHFLRRFSPKNKNQWQSKHIIYLWPGPFMLPCPWFSLPRLWHLAMIALFSFYFWTLLTLQKLSQVIRTYFHEVYIQFWTSSKPLQKPMGWVRGWSGITKILVYVSAWTDCHDNLEGVGVCRKSL